MDWIVNKSIITVLLCIMMLFAVCLFLLCNHVTSTKEVVFLSLFASLFVCLSAEHLKKLWMNFHEFYMILAQGTVDQILVVTQVKNFSTFFFDTTSQSIQLSSLGGGMRSNECSLVFCVCVIIVSQQLLCFVGNVMLSMNWCRTVVLKFEIIL